MRRTLPKRRAHRAWPVRAADKAKCGFDSHTMRRRAQAAKRLDCGGGDGERRLFPAEDHAKHGQTITAQLRAAHSRDRTDPHVLAVVDSLLKTSEEFAEIWSEHPVTGPYGESKRIEHPQLGLLEVHGHSLADPDQSQILMVFTAPPGSESHNKLQVLAVRGHQLV